MKRKMCANVRMTITRQVEFYIDVDALNSDVEERALEVARLEWGNFDEAEITEMAWRENPPGMIVW